MEVRTRIAPSPTGYLHFGTVRSALFSFLYARKNGGKFIIRIEDTDTERNRQEYDDDILEQMKWLGLEADEIYRQSENINSHKAAIQKMISEDTAYVSKEKAKDDSEREVEVVRLRNPGKEIIFNDEVRGEIKFDTTELGDFVIARTIEDPLYHLAVVVDDAEENITHVIRGEDHISNTPRQILIQEALGYDRPVYAHLPLILAPDKSKMSKRKHETSIKQYREKGYLPKALINYLALLGWNPGTDQEFFSIEELIKEFDLSHIQKSGAIFDIEKLKWFNRNYLQKIPEEEFSKEAIKILKGDLNSKNIPYSEDVANSIIPIIREQISVWEDLHIKNSEGEYDFFFAEPNLDPSLIPGKKSDSETARKHLSHIREILESLSEKEITYEIIKDSIWDYADKEGRGDVLWPLRYCLSGKERSPDPFTIILSIGIQSSVLRITRALETL